MVNVLPSARPRAAAFGRKLNFAMAVSTARRSSSLTFTVRLMMREAVLAETPASRATIFSVTELRGRGPRLPRTLLGTFLDFSFIASSRRRPQQRALQLLECPALGLRSMEREEQQAGKRHEAIAQESAGRPEAGKFPREYQRDTGADQGIPEPDHRDGRATLLVREDLRQHHPHDRTQRDGKTRHESDDREQHQMRVDERHGARDRRRGMEGPADGQQRHGHAGNADQQQRPSAEAVDEPNRDQGHANVDQTDQHRLSKRRCQATTRSREDGRQVVENRIDAGNLLEESNAEGKQQYKPEAPAKDAADADRAGCGPEALLDLRPLLLRGNRAVERR